MPVRARKTCGQMGCGVLVPGGQSYCDQHQRLAHRRYNERRDAGDRFYGLTPWKRARAAQLARQPLCEECLRHDRTEPATVVDHIVPRKADPARSLDPGNFRSLCASCHARIGEQVRRDSADREGGSNL